jgi:xanthine/uracil permease
MMQQSRADLAASAVWLALGLLTVQQSWVMDRLEHQGADPWSVPGLVPGILGVVMTVLGLALMYRSLRGGPAADAGDDPEETAAEARAGRFRLLSALVLCLVFTLALLGNGLPFWIAAAAFIAAFILSLDRERGPRRIAFALGYGVVVGVTIHLLFEKLFLVRLP